MAGWRQAPRAENPQLGPKAEQERCVVLGLRALWRSTSRGCHPTPMSVRALGLRMALAAAYHDRRLAVVDGVELEVRAYVWVDAVALHVYYVRLNCVVL